MGEAKRRKQLDPNFGKDIQNQRNIGKEVGTFTVGIYDKYEQKQYLTQHNLDYPPNEIDTFANMLGFVSVNTVFDTDNRVYAVFFQNYDDSDTILTTRVPVAFFQEELQAEKYAQRLRDTHKQI